MTLCCICNRNLFKGEQIGVLSYPIRCVGNDGDYSFLGDFSENEKIFHASCLEQLSPENFKTFLFSSSIKPTDTSPEAGNVSIFIQTLRGLGEDSPLEEIKRFFNQNSHITDDAEMIKEWFKNRKQFV